MKSNDFAKKTQKRAWMTARLDKWQLFDKKGQDIACYFRKNLLR